ncbi:hypothetical protein QTP70_024601, partial [Hemibagrus guttatus]
MIKCRPFYLPREFSAIVVTAAYIPLDATAKAAMEEVHAAISKQQAAHPAGAIIVAGDFNHSNLRSVLPKLHQHVICTTRGDNALDHVYTNIAEAYRAISLSHLGQSDHLSLFMLTTYTPLIKRVKPSVKTVKVWPVRSISSLQQQQQVADWSMFASQATSDSQTDFTFYTSSVLDRINMCIDNVTTVKHVKHFPNQKPWMNSEVHLLLKAKDAAFKSGDAEDYSRARANLKRRIRKTKLAHKLRIVEHFHSNSDPRHMWEGIQTITDHKPSIQSLLTSNAFLPDEQSSSLLILTKASYTTPEILTPPWLFIQYHSHKRVPKHSSAKCLKDFRSVALPPIVKKCFEKLVLCHLIACLPPTLDPRQCAYRSNRSTENAISTAIHLALTHLDNNNTYIRMMFIDFSSAFNTVVPSKLIAKLSDLGICTSLCSWIMDFLTNRPQSVRLGNHISSTFILNTGVPQGCVPSPLLYSLFTSDCVPLHNSNIFIKYADDTTVVGRISNNDELAYREEIQRLSAWCSMNNLTLNATKTKELIVDFWKSNSSRHFPIFIN